MNKQRDVKKLQTQLIKTMIKLAEHKVPVSAVIFSMNEVRTEGTLNLKNVVNTLDKNEINDAIKADVINLQNPSNDPVLVDIDESHAVRNILFERQEVENIPELLPFPLMALNKKEKMTYITKEILKEQLVLIKEPLKLVKWGESRLKPSFWPDDFWAWIEVKKNLSQFSNEMYTGKGSFMDFLTETIKRCLQMAGKNPDEYVRPNIDNVMLEKKMVKKGIHSAPSIERNNEEGALMSDYIMPLANRNRADDASTFLPRRSLPGNQALTVPGLDPESPSVAVIAERTDEYIPEEDLINANTFLPPSDYDYLITNRDIINPPEFLNNLR